MESYDLPNWESNITCRECGVSSVAKNYPSTSSNPFSHDNAFDGLNEYQQSRLQQNWNRCRFGKRYRTGEWTRCQMKPVIEHWNQCRDYGVIISGAMGTGKTVAMGLMMACLAASNEFSFMFWNSSSLLTFLHNWGGYGEEFYQDYLLQDLRKCKWLFLDDMGVEYNSPMAMSRFNEIIELRHSNELQFVGTSNLTESDLSRREGWDRIIERVQQDAEWCELGGASMRRNQG